MGNAGSKTKSRFQNKTNDTSEFQILLKNRFYEIANGETFIDKAIFFVSFPIIFPVVKFNIQYMHPCKIDFPQLLIFQEYTEARICPQLQSFLYDALSKPENIVSSQFEVLINILPLRTDSTNNVNQ